MLGDAYVYQYLHKTKVIEKVKVIFSTPSTISDIIYRRIDRIADNFSIFHTVGFFLDIWKERAAYPLFFSFWNKFLLLARLERYTTRIEFSERILTNAIQAQASTKRVQYSIDDFDISTSRWIED